MLLLRRADEGSSDVPDHGRAEGSLVGIEGLALDGDGIATGVPPDPDLKQGALVALHDKGRWMAVDGGTRDGAGCCAEL
jgi:hypothetical protein